MYFKEKEDTNIDKEFEKEKKINFNFDFKKLNPKILLFVGVGIIVLFIIIFIIISLTGNKNNYVIELQGEETITINLGDEYKEPGYSAYNGNTDVTADVEIISTVDTTKTGEYEILYSIGSENVIRYVKVIENIEATYIYLSGKKNMYLEVGEKFTEPGYQVYDSKEQNLTEKVVITGTVDTNKVGTYRLTYTVVNSRNITTSVVRTVVVVEKGKKPQN